MNLSDVSMHDRDAVLRAHGYDQTTHFPTASNLLSDLVFFGIMLPTWYAKMFSSVLPWNSSLLQAGKHYGMCSCHQKIRNRTVPQSTAGTAVITIIFCWSFSFLPTTLSISLSLSSHLYLSFYLMPFYFIYFYVFLASSFRHFPLSFLNIGLKIHINRVTSMKNKIYQLKE